MAKEQLLCEVGNHKWSREATRGRKPTACPKHKVAVSVPKNPTVDGHQELHCQIGNHKWTRQAARGRVPLNCPEHKPAVTQSVKTDKGMTVLHCEIGNHEWERAAQRGRRPVNCPDHSVASTNPAVTDNLGPNEVLLSEDSDGSARVLILDDEFYEAIKEFIPQEKKRGRPRIHETDEEAKEAALHKSRERTDNLEMLLKSRGTHLSQQTPYKLFRKEVKGKVETWVFVSEFSPLNHATYLNAHEAEFLNGNYKFERDGELVAA